MRDTQCLEDPVDVHTLGLLTNKTIAAFLATYDFAQWPEVILLATLQGVLCFQNTFGYEKVPVAELRSAVQQEECLLNTRSPHGPHGKIRTTSPTQETSARSTVQSVYPEWWGDGIISTSGAASPLRHPKPACLPPSSCGGASDGLQRRAAAPPVCTTRKHTGREAKSRVQECLQQAQKLARHNAAKRTERVQQAVCRHRAAPSRHQPYSNMHLEWPVSGSHDSLLSNPWVAALVQQDGHGPD